MDYQEFLNKKSQMGSMDGFKPLWIPDFLFDFQKSLVGWALMKGRAAIFADCGLGKTPMQLVWAENVVRKTNKPVLIVTPLAVSYQSVREGEKFSIDCVRNYSGQVSGSRIVVTNYEKLHLFSSSDFSGMVCDESSILKNFDGVRRSEITEFMRKMPYRLLCTATAAPNDYTELGTSSEALGELGHMDMLTRFFRNQNSNATDTRGHWRGFHAPRMFEGKQWRFKHHAEVPFWKWICSWARAVRKPSDIGFSDGEFILPPLSEIEHLTKAQTRRPGWLFDVPAVGLQEEREERRRTIKERCEKASELVASNSGQSLVWCHLNPEGDLLERLIPDCVQVSGKDSDEEKEEKLLSFADGKVKNLITKHKIGAWGLNLQNCSHIVSFASHSYEQYYQGIRRCWRFGQKNPVTVEMVVTEGEQEVTRNLQRKSAQADRMFASLVEHVKEAQRIETNSEFKKETRIPSWLLKIKSSPTDTPSTLGIAAK